MDIEEIKSSLDMRNLYFSECKFVRAAVLKNGSFHTDISKAIQQIAEHEYIVSLRLVIDKEDFNLLAVANATFIYKGDDAAEREQSIIQNNTIAIMYPFVRSQVTLMTSQPGMSPIVLPPINTTLLQ